MEVRMNARMEKKYIYLVFVCLLYTLPNALDLEDSVLIKVNERIDILEPAQRCDICHDIPVNDTLIDSIEGCFGGSISDYVYYILFDDNVGTVANFNGTDYNPISRDYLWDILLTFERNRSSDIAIAYYKYARERADRWWRKNKRINYIPLQVFLVDYKLFEDESTPCNFSDKTFFTVIPYKDNIGSQIIVFGFQDEFTHTNTNKAVSSIKLDIGGIQYTINTSGYAVTKFDNAGTYAIKAEVTFLDNTSFKSAFNMNIYPFSDNSWSNSILTENNKLDFFIQ